MNCLNLEKREELGWKSPFEIYFGKKANELVNEGQNCDTIDISKYSRPSAKINTSWQKNGGEMLAIELLEECWIVMHVKIHASYINVVVRCSFELAEKKVDR